MAEQRQLTSIKGGLTNAQQGYDAGAIQYGRVQPQAIPLEEVVPGAILIDKNALPAVMDILKVETFYKQAHQEIFKVILELFHKSQPIDILTVQEALKKAQLLESIGGITYLAALTNSVSSAANIEYHSRILTQKYIQRELIKVSTEIIKDSYEDTKDIFELLDSAERSLFDITDQNLNTAYERLGALALKTQKEIEAVSRQTGELTGITTGFEELDKITSGWQPSDLIILAARPGMGKTAFALSLGRNAALANKAVAIFSLEMSKSQLVQRLIAMEAEINSHKIRNGKLDEYEWKKLHEAVERMMNIEIYIDDTPAINIFELRAKCRRMKQQHNIQLVVIDYLQLMSSAPGQTRGNREQEISTISRSLKSMAKELNVPIIALSQLSRAVETRGGDKRPQLSDLRESGAIEQDADIVSFVYRPDYYGTDDEFEGSKDTSEIIISKHRNGSLGTVELRFIKELVKFTEPVSHFRSMSTSEGFMDPNDPLSSGSIRLQSKMNKDTFEADDIPF
ncbi:MAG TPA: replicative DNA helicase [Saprospirales bacterium]|nr:replicative DNA helicase [Saprospirales bacterium]